MSEGKREQFDSTNQESSPVSSIQEQGGFDSLLLDKTIKSMYEISGHQPITEKSIERYLRDKGKYDQGIKNIASNTRRLPQRLSLHQAVSFIRNRQTLRVGRKPKDA